MRVRKPHLATLAAAGVVLLLPASSSAATFYADPARGDDTRACTDPALPCASIQAAVEKARATPERDTIEAAAGKYAEITLNNSADAGLTINGASTSGGEDGTRIVKLPTVQGYAVAMGGGAAPADLTLHNVRVIVPVPINNKGGIDIRSSGSLLRDVVVEMLDPANDQPAIRVAAGTTLDRVATTGDWAGGGVIDSNLGDGTLVIRDSDLRSDGPGGTRVLSTSENRPAIVQRTRLERGGTQDAVVAAAGRLTIDSSLLLGGLSGLRLDGGDATLRHVTIDAGANRGGDDSAGGAAAIGANTGMVPRSATATVDSSILMEGSDVASPGGGLTVSVSCTRTLAPAQSFTDANGGSVQCGPAGDNQPADAAALFNNAAASDYHLRAGSAAVDRGAPAPLAGDESDTDLDRNARVLDGNEDCIAVSDRGAYELTGHANSPPVPAISGPATTPIATPVTYTGVAADEDPQSALGFAWSFPTGTATGPGVTWSFPAVGEQSVALTVTDTHGCAATARHTTNVTPDVTAPVLSKVSLTHRTFRVKRTTASAARSPRGTAFRYTLSEPAKLRVTIEQIAAGRRVGRRCVKPTTRNRKRKSCRRYIRRGALSQNGRAGANRLSFTGRLRGRRLKAGSYRARLVATDAAGNHSRERRLSFKIAKR